MSNGLDSHQARHFVWPDLGPNCAHVLLILLNKFGKRDGERLVEHFITFFATSLINSIIREHEYHMTLKLLKNHIFGVKTSRFCHVLHNVIADVIMVHTIL